ncbi:MAG TPA: AAA family ATPase, partial [Candidatus Acidoferrales bacterium]|nr:AAA family ATPase [Candidatus Acidoferrales bacterium]
MTAQQEASTGGGENTYPRPALPQFVGRIRELAELRAGLEDALGGRGRLFLVSGEPGVGKTRLADEFSVRAASSGSCVLWGRCWEGGGAPAYWPILQVVRALIARRELAPAVPLLSGEKLALIASIAPELRQLSNLHIAEKSPAPASDREKARFELFDSVASLFRACAAVVPLVLVIDDLHDADQSSLQMLTFIAKGLKDSRAMIVGTHRDAEVRRSPELGERIGDLNREGSTLPLGGLSRSEVAEFVTSRSGRTAEEDVVARVYSATDGNPLFVDGVVRLMLADHEFNNPSGRDAGFKLPHGVRESIRRQLSALPEEAQELLKIAAVIGNEFDANLIANQGEIKAAEVANLLEHAIAAGVVSRSVSASGRYRFSHALIRNAVYDDLSPVERSQLHLQTATSIEELHASDLKPHLAALAHHFREAGHWEKAVDYSILAAEASLTVYAYDEALSHRNEALELLDLHDGNPGKKADLLTGLGWLLETTSPQKAVDHLERALGLYEALKAVDDGARVHMMLGGIFARSGPLNDPPRALVHLRKAEPVLRVGKQEPLPHTY